MGAFEEVDAAAVDAALRADPELAKDLGPLLEDQYGSRARKLFVRCFAAHLRTARHPGTAALPALADAIYTAAGVP